MIEFVPGLRLCERFYFEAVGPLLQEKYSRLSYAAGLLDHGSEVLGFDTATSTDHDWGPRLQIFLSPADIRKRRQISDFLRQSLPPTFEGYSTNYEISGDDGARLMAEAKLGDFINHRIEINTVSSFLGRYIGVNVSKELAAHQWLTLSEQKLATIRYGKIFHDQIGLAAVRKRLHYFPEDIWRFMLASEWMRINQEQPFIGRTGEVGDEIGSRLITARLVQSIMRLCFLMERQYAPYSKWFGSAFRQLSCYGRLSPALIDALQANGWRDREAALNRALTEVAGMHNETGLTPPQRTDAKKFHGRSFSVIDGARFADAICDTIADPKVKKISRLIGSVNQFTDSVEVLESNSLLKSISRVYLQT